MGGDIHNKENEDYIRQEIRNDRENGSKEKSDDLKDGNKWTERKEK